ncbi:GNAT family N-acetyltransferase [Brachybacterium squillarum]|uniref:GNAT family N-acetyltransferase n=1 Tax=Brachybacterium squillarum TaxID=661979 RepID=UPI0022226640|nr:GNAT family N-acetyltransferase [Brachybacterium squillarum]MCW1804163.1 GNAT family N-acetyltransferase [Brachybacterium squillarum]
MGNHADLAITLRAGTPPDIEQCVSLWVEACAARDGRLIGGIADRARPKFDRSIGWIVALRGEQVEGFVLSTAPGSGMPIDPPDAAVVGLLAVNPKRQARGLGRTLLQAIARQLAEAGYGQAVLHALLDNQPALKLYRNEGWIAVGDEYEHSLLKRPLQTFSRSLLADGLEGASGG